MPVETTDTKIVLERESPDQVVLVTDDDPVVIEIQDTIAIAVREESVTVIEVSTGLIGPQGPQGPQGDPGAGTGYAYDQILPASIWTINHALGYRPGGIIVIDSGGNEVKGAITYPTANQAVITFSSAFAGVAYLS